MEGKFTCREHLKITFLLEWKYSIMLQLPKQAFGAQLTCCWGGEAEYCCMIIKSASILLSALSCFALLSADWGAGVIWGGSQVCHFFLCFFFFFFFLNDTLETFGLRCLQAPQSFFGNAIGVKGWQTWASITIMTEWGQFLRPGCYFAAFNVKWAPFSFFLSFFFFCFFFFIGVRVSR